MEQALEVALEVEETELEDLVGDLLKAIKQEREYERYLRLLVHDLGDLSYMIERTATTRAAVAMRRAGGAPRRDAAPGCNRGITPGKQRPSRPFPTLGARRT